MSEQKDKNQRAEPTIEEIIDKVGKTFTSILIFNWILVSMGVVAFALAVYQAFQGEIVLTGLFGALGTADVITLFKFSMDRVQRCLGDQVQVYEAEGGLKKEREFIEGLRSKPGLSIDEVRQINREIRKSTLNSMELIQNFTKIAEPIDREPWIRKLPIRYGKLKLNGSEKKGIPITEEQEITFSGSYRNNSWKFVKIKTVVIAVRPPGGTPDGGPFRFNFYIDGRHHRLRPFQSITIEETKKNIKVNAITGEEEEIRPEWYRPDWYAFMTCQTSDDCWHDDNNKFWFEVKKINTKSNKP